VIAADLARLEADEDARFKAWLNRCLTEDLGGRTLISTQEDRPNNWGSMCGASRAAVARYLRNTSELAACARILHAFVGDRSSHTGFTYSLEAFTWMPDPEIPRPINALGASIHGFNVGGAVVDDISRGGPFQWPPIRTGYPGEGLAGAYACAEILQRAGYPAYSWENNALRRAIDCLWDLHTQFPSLPSWWNDDGDEQWITWLANKRYGTSYEVYSPVAIGKNMGFTDWTHR
jgi:hypothetical protein